MSYYDLDAILTDAEKVPCQFQFDIPDLGHLDNSPSLKAGSSVLLPLWLAETLAVAEVGASQSTATRSPPVVINLPGALRREVLSALKADPRAVPLRDQSAHFYELGTRMLELFDMPDIAAVLRRTYVTRAAEVQLHARLAGEDAMSGGGGSGGVRAAAGSESTGEEFLRGLEDWERALFRKAHEAVKSGKGFMDKVKKH